MIKVLELLEIYSLNAIWSLERINETEDSILWLRDNKFLIDYNKR